MYSIIKTIYINRKINIGVPEKRKLFGERRNDEMSELMTFSLSNKKSRHERYAVRDDVVEMAVIARFASALTDTPRLKTVHRTVFLTAVSITFHSKNKRPPQGRGFVKKSLPCGFCNRLE